MVPHECASGPEALAAIQRSGPFDIAILDVQMPEMDGITLAHEIRRLYSAENLPLVGLSSVGQRSAEIAGAGFASMLTKPIKQSQLYNVLADVFTSREHAAQATLNSGSAYDGNLGHRFPLRILMAEDLTVNQKLLQSLLHKFGYRADVAGNGLEVLKALERQTYDVILMDVQMPEMDGLEASRQIVKRYPLETRPRIVALTANAMREDQQTCYAAGMDDYLAKPIHTPALQASLVRCGQWAQAREANRRAQRASAPPAGAYRADGIPPASQGRQPSQDSLQEPHADADDSNREPILDPTLLADYADMPDVILELLQAFRTDALPLLAEMREAAQTGNAALLKHAAHGIKGAAANLGGQRLAIRCARLEQMGRDGNTQGAAALVPLMQTEFDRFCLALEASTEN